MFFGTEQALSGVGLSIRLLHDTAGVGWHGWLMKPAVVLCMVGLAGAAAAAEPSQAALDDAVKLGTVATLAPLCGTRDEAWAFDVRRATIMDAARAARPDDPALQAAPGSQLVIGALSFAEAEALESFAEAPAADTCGPLEADPVLKRADAMVRAFRALKTGAVPKS